MASVPSSYEKQLQAQSQISSLSSNDLNENIHHNDYNRHHRSNQAHVAVLPTSASSGRNNAHQNSCDRIHHTRQIIGPSRAAVNAAPGLAIGSIVDQHMSQDDIIEGQTRSLVHSSSLLASSYDGYNGGMSSDSELTTSGSNARHGHHHYYHRPYSSQSRVYYAHPVPRNHPSSRLSHYYDPIAASMHSASSTSIPQVAQSGPYQTMQAAGSLQHPSMPQHLSSETGMGSNQIAPLSHQGPNPSSGSASSAYLGGMMPNEPPISPIMMQQQPRSKAASGRQLPQRPFRQSMSIDPNHSYDTSGGVGVGSSSHFSSQISDSSSPVHHQTRLTMPQRSAIDLADHYGQQKTYQARNIRRELDVMEKQAAELSLYDDDESHFQRHQKQQTQQPVLGLPPTGIMHRPPSSASISRHLPTLGQQQQAQQSLIGSISIDQSQHRMNPDDSYHQQHHTQLQHQPTDPYTAHRQHQSVSVPHQQQSSPAMTDWFAPIGLSNQYSRQAGHFKQTMSIDHYQSGASNRHRHYSPSRSSNLTGDQYHSLGSYTNSPEQSQQLIDNYESSNHANTQAYYSPMSSNQDKLYHKQSKHQQQHQQVDSSGQHHHQHSQHAGTQDYNTPGRSYERTGSSSSAPVGVSVVPQQSQQAHGIRAKQLQHQISDSSSNSNLSGSFKLGQMDSNLFDRHAGASSENQKSISSTSASSSHFHQSPQHRTSTNTTGGHQHHYRQDVLRRGYTSVAMTGGGFGDLGGSQSALSEAGDFSLSQASHSGSASNKRHNLRAASPSLAIESASSHHRHHHAHHSASSSHGPPGMRSESSTGLPNGSESNSTLTKKSNSATQLSMTGTKKRLGFRKKQVTSFSVHRSEEVAPLEARHLVKQGSSVSEGDSSMSGDSSSRSWSNSNFKPQTSEELASMSFIDGLGKGQMISRQGLTSPYLGDIQLSLCDRRGNLEVEVIRARNLVAKTSKVQPLTYVKLYLVKNRKCLAKAKTTLSNKRTLNPLYQQQLTFHEDYHGCILQSIVWGNFGKMDKKNFMGIAQISIDDLELSDTVISWYKLFLPSSLQTLPSKSLRHTLLSNSTESFTNTNNS